MVTAGWVSVKSRPAGTLTNCQTVTLATPDTRANFPFQKEEYRSLGPASDGARRSAAQSVARQAFSDYTVRNPDECVRARFFPGDSLEKEKWRCAVSAGSATYFLEEPVATVYAPAAAARTRSSGRELSARGAKYKR
jgi:hypothetical protein